MVATARVAPKPPGRRSRDEARHELDLGGGESLRHWATDLGLLGLSVERLVVDAVDGRFGA
jgi:hypothetical protein